MNSQTQTSLRRAAAELRSFSPRLAAVAGEFSRLARAGERDAAMKAAEEMGQLRERLARVGGKDAAELKARRLEQEASKMETEARKAEAAARRKAAARAAHLAPLGSAMMAGFDLAGFRARQQAARLERVAAQVGADLRDPEQLGIVLELAAAA